MSIINYEAHEGQKGQHATVKEELRLINYIQ